jgi:hypothetical protein
MPGLLPIYAPLYLVFGTEWAKFFVIILQFLVEVLSVILLAQTASMIFKNKSLWILCLGLFLINNFVSVYTLYACSEAFCISFFIISFYFLFKHLQTLKSSDLFLAGLFLCWAIFFRTVIVLFIPIYIYLLIKSSYSNNSLNLGKAVKKISILFAVFLIFDSIWIIRNFKVYDKFIPLNGSFKEIATDQELALYQLIIAWGGDIANWNPSEGRWFIKPSNSKTRVYDADFQNTNPFHSSIFTPDYNLDSLKKLRVIYWKSFGYNTSLDSMHYYQNQFCIKAAKNIESFKKYKPFHFYIFSKLSHLKTFVLIKRPYALPFIKNNLSNKLMRVVSLLFYYFILGLGIFGIILVWIKGNIFFVKIFSLGVVIFILTHAYFGYSEFRYILPVYPILTMYAAYSLFEIFNWYKRYKITQKLSV